MFGLRSSLALYAIASLYATVSGLVLPKIGNAGYVRLNHEALSPRASFAGGILLRIEPLGASITHGVASSDGNGYRKYLRDAIVANGNQVDMVGSNPNGTMSDNENSGWPGFIIDQVHDKSNSDTAAYRPNLILVNAGTNDAIQNVDIPNSGARMRSMLADVYAQSTRATVVLSGLIRNADSGTQARAVQINSQFQSLAASLRAEGKAIIWADMQGSNGPLASDLSPDGTHPVDLGYQKMATIWYNAIGQADAAGFLRTAV